MLRRNIASGGGGGGGNGEPNSPSKKVSEEIDSDDDRLLSEKLDSETETEPATTEPVTITKGPSPPTVSSSDLKTEQVLSPVLHGLSDRWKNWVIRGIFTWVMIGAFCFLIWIGPIALMIVTLAVQVKCFAEIINIGYSVYKVHNLPWFRSLSWYFLVTSNYFFYGESIMDYFGVLVNRTEILRWLITYHRFLSFSMYIIGFVWFVLSLVKKYYMRQFSLFAWTHVALLIVVTQSYLIIQNIFEGMIWFIVPVSMIVCNDVMAYMFGFFFGRTPLIKLSPKKTWEGFIGGGFSTVIFGLGVSYVLCHYPFFVCPVEYDEDDNTLGLDCEPSYLFHPQQYALPPWFLGMSHIFGFRPYITIYPFLLHSLSMSVFSSVIGPFGGFFASGFKRAFKIKDFGDIIPGHGGILDRFDCQFLMATFVNVYITSFIRIASPQKLLQQVLSLKPEHQLQLYNSLRESLTYRGILQVHGQP